MLLYIPRLIEQAGREAIVDNGKDNIFSLPEKKM
jgi:hypothetical protein